VRFAAPLGICALESSGSRGMWKTSAASGLDHAKAAGFAGNITNSFDSESSPD